MEPTAPRSDAAPIRVLIADDDPRLLSLLRVAIAAEPGIEIVAEVDTADGIGPVAARTRRELHHNLPHPKSMMVEPRMMHGRAHVLDRTATCSIRSQ